jgi:hypothetical protein
MRTDLFQPAATITVELLRNPSLIGQQLTEEIIASAFEQAYRGLEAGLDRIRKEDAALRSATVTPLKA